MFGKPPHKGCVGACCRGPFFVFPVIGVQKSDGAGLRSCGYGKRRVGQGELCGPPGRCAYGIERAGSSADLDRRCAACKR